MSRRPLGSNRTKAFSALRRFANRLGWSGLRRHRHVFERDPAEIIWYDTRDDNGFAGDIFLQINECPLGQTISYTTAVYAVRYRLCTGWHSMRLTPDSRYDDAEAQRLEPWLHRRWFSTLEGRRAFRVLHPECCGWSGKRVNAARLPYEVADALNCITAKVD